MIEKLYKWMMKQAESKNSVRVLSLVSFIESSFFPFPPDPVLAIVVAKNKDKATYYALICTISSVLGGFLGYYIGYAFFETIGSPIITYYGQVENFEKFATELNKWAFWLICAKGLTPIPYKIVTIASGLAKIDLCIFGVASLITRSMRFLLLSYICKAFGEKVLAFIERYKKVSLFLIIASIILGFMLVKLLV